MEKYDFLDKNRKPTLKERVKRVVALALTLGTLAGFTACKTQTGKTTDTSNTIPNPPSISTMTDNSVTEPEEPIFTTIDNGTTGPEHTDPIPAEIPVAEINAFAESLKGGNFTTYAANTTRKQVGDMVELEMPGDFHKIVSLEDGINYVYDYDATQDKWTKDFLEVPVDGPFTNAYNQLFEQTTWNSYDEKTGEISGIWTPSEELVSQYQGVNETVDVVLKLTESGAELSFLGSNARIFDINKTQITLPQTYIDNTIENQDIYSVDEQGNYDFNLVLMKEVLLDWMKGNNRYGRDFMKEFFYDERFAIQDLIYVNASKESISIGLLTYDVDQLRYQELQINDNDLYTALANQNLKTKDEFSAHLYNMKKTRTRFSDAIKIDTSLSKSDFQTITTNIFNHLVNVGTQSSINEEGELHPEYANAKVLFGFVNKGGDGVGYDMGVNHYYNFYYIIEIENELKLLDIPLAVSSSLDDIKNDIPRRWVISKSLNYKQNINNGNEKILPEEKFITSETTFEKEMEL